MYSTNLSLTVSSYKYVQISISQEAATNMYKSLPQSKLVQVCTVQISLSPSARTNMCKSLSHKKLALRCTNLSLTVSWYHHIQYKSLSPRTLVRDSGSLPISLVPVFLVAGWGVVVWGGGGGQLNTSELNACSSVGGLMLWLSTWPDVYKTWNE